MSVETELQTLTTNVTTLVSNVNTQQSLIDTNRVTWDQTVTDLAALTASVLSGDSVVDADRPTRTATTVSLGLKQNNLSSVDSSSAVTSGDQLRTINNQSIFGTDDLSIIITSTTTIMVKYEDRGTLRDIPSSPHAESDTVTIHHIGLCRFHVRELDENGVLEILEPDDDETCFTAADEVGQWLLAEPAYDLIQAHAMVEHSLRDELDEDEAVRFSAYLTTQGLI